MGTWATILKVSFLSKTRTVPRAGIIFSSRYQMRKPRLRAAGPLARIQSQFCLNPGTLVSPLAGASWASRPCWRACLPASCRPRGTGGCARSPPTGPSGRVHLTDGDVRMREWPPRVNTSPGDLAHPCGDLELVSLPHRVSPAHHFRTSRSSPRAPALAEWRLRVLAVVEAAA